MSHTKYQSKNQIVYEKIRDAIISGEFEPGSRIVIDNLALDYNVSHSPIRECMRLLEADGFVTIRPYAGITVTELQPELITEVFALLESLEIITSCQASIRATSEQFDELEKLVIRMERCVSSSDEWSAKNLDFHMTICDFADMTITKRMMYSAFLHWDRLRRYYLEEVSAHRIRQAQIEHRELLDAMKAGDHSQIAAIIQKHNKAALCDYLDYIKESHTVDIYMKDCKHK